MTEQQPFDTSPLPVKLRVEDYLLLDDTGAFDGYAKTELLDGEILFMNAQHRPHARIKSRLFIEIAAALQGSGLEAIVEGSITIPPHNVPEPDIVVTAEAEGEGLIPLPSVRLIVEVADTTVRHDLTRKARIYAAAGVPEYWVVDVRAVTIHQLWSPDAGEYRERRELPLRGRVTAATLACLSIDATGL